MRLSHTTLFALAALCYTSQAFVIPLGRVTSAPSPTKRALVGRHERDRGHGHGRHGQHGPSGQQNQGAPSDQQEGHAQDGQQGGNVVTVYTTVTGSPPEQTSSDSSGDRKECKGGKKGPEEHQEAAQTPPEQGPNEPPKAEDQSPPVMGQTETPLDPKDTGREGSDDAKQPQPLTAANNGEMGIQAAQRKQSEDSKGQEEPPANNGDSGEAKKQDPPAKPEDEAKPPADTHNDQGGASHSDVPDDPVPQAKKAEGNPTGGNVLTSDEQQKVLALHNSIREANGQPKLEWDDKLASFSAGWMNKCVSHHDHSGGYVALRLDAREGQMLTGPRSATQEIW
jgi:uncharacterized protein YkwD